METVACNLCGSDKLVPVLTGRDRQFGIGGVFRVVKCLDCSLVRVTPRPDEHEMGAHYLSEYQAAISAAHQVQVTAPKGLEGWAFNMILNRRIPPFVPGGRVLDIGCSGGAYLVALRKLGWDVQGVERDPDAARLARDQFGLNVHAGTAETVVSALPDNHFDVVTMWHVFEHISDPVRLLADIRRILKPGGRMMLEVPNFASCSRHLFRTYWFPLDLPRHLYHFTSHSLEMMLTQAGFISVQIKGVPAALAATLSLQLLLNRATGNRSSQALVFNRPLLITLFPLSVVLARFGLSAHMTAEARTPPG